LNTEPTDMEAVMDKLKNGIGRDWTGYTPGAHLGISFEKITTSGSGCKVSDLICWIPSLMLWVYR